MTPYDPHPELWASSGGVQPQPLDKETRKAWDAIDWHRQDGPEWMKHAWEEHGSLDETKGS